MLLHFFQEQPNFSKRRYRGGTVLYKYFATVNILRLDVSDSGLAIYYPMMDILWASHKLTPRLEDLKSRGFLILYKAMLFYANVIVEDHRSSHHMGA